MALFFAQRGHCLFDNLLAAQAAEAYGRAHSLAPEQPAHHNHWGLAVILHRAVEELKLQGAETPYAMALRMPPPKDDYEKRVYPVVHQHLNRILSNAKAKRTASPRDLVFTEFAAASRLTNH